MSSRSPSFPTFARISNVDSGSAIFFVESVNLSDLF